MRNTEVRPQSNPQNQTSKSDRRVRRGLSWLKNLHLWIHQLDLHRRARFLRSQGRQVKIRGGLLVINGGRVDPSLTSSQMRLHRVVKQRASAHRLNSAPQTVISFPQHSSP